MAVAEADARLTARHHVSNAPKVLKLLAFDLSLNGSQRHDVLFFPSEGLALLQRIHILRCLRVTWDNRSVRQTAT